MISILWLIKRVLTLNHFELMMVQVLQDLQRLQSVSWQFLMVIMVLKPARWLQSYCLSISCCIHIFFLTARFCLYRKSLWGCCQITKNIILLFKNLIGIMSGIGMHQITKGASLSQPPYFMYGPTLCVLHGSERL